MAATSFGIIRYDVPASDGASPTPLEGVYDFVWFDGGNDEAMDIRLRLIELDMHGVITLYHWDMTTRGAVILEARIKFKAHIPADWYLD